MTRYLSVRSLFPAGPARAGRLGPVLVVALGLVLAGCSASPEPASTSARAYAAAPAPDQGAPHAGSGRVAAEDREAAPTAEQKEGPAPLPVGPMLAKKANIGLEVSDVADAAGRVRAIAGIHGGFVLEESIGSSGGGERAAPPALPNGEPFGGYGTLMLSVPPAALEATLTDLAKLGTVVGRGSSATDVTREVVDTSSRIANMRASVDRVRSLMAQARDVGQVVLLESELSRRQADLESLEAQLKALKARVAQATVSVSLSTPAYAAATVTGGFAAGLSAGWDAFLTSGRVALTAVGAVLPFALLLLFVGLPVLAWLRRRTRRTVGAGHDGEGRPSSAIRQCHPDTQTDEDRSSDAFQADAHRLT